MEKVSKMRNYFSHQTGFGAFVSHPGVVLAISLIGASIFTLLMLPLPRFAGERRWYLIAYHAPIVAVFISYFFDRIKHRAEIRPWQWGIEAVIVALALIRAVFSIPYISGHALFLSYVLVTTPLRLVWWFAILVFAEVIYIKVAVLNDPTLIGGVIGGVIGGAAVGWGERRSHPQM